MGPRISVIIPVYNAARYLEETLASVFAQTYRDYEVIVVNDGSTDESALVLAPYARDGRIRYLDQANAGVAAARNRALREAGGELVAFLDADDLWLPEKLEKQVHLLTRQPGVGLVYADLVNFYPGGDEAYSLFQVKQPAAGWVLDRLFYGNFVPTPTVVVRLAVLKEVGLFDESIQINEDVDLFLRLAERCEFAYVDEVLVRRRMCLTSLIHSRPEQIHRQDLALIDHWSRRRPDLFSPDRPSVIRRQALIHGRLGRACWHNGKYGEARKHLLQGLLGGWRSRDAIPLLLLSFLPRLSRFVKMRRASRRPPPKGFA